MFFLVLFGQRLYINSQWKQSNGRIKITTFENQGDPILQLKSKGWKSPNFTIKK